MGKPLYTESVNGKRRVPSKGGKGSTVGFKERFSFIDLEGGYQLFEPIKGFDLSLVPSIPLYQLKPIVTPYPLTPYLLLPPLGLELVQGVLGVTLSPSSPPKIEGRITPPPLKEEKRGGMVDAAPYGGWSFLCRFKEEKSRTNPVLALTPITPNPTGGAGVTGVRRSKGYETLSFLDKKKRGFPFPKRQKKELKGLEVYTSRPKEEVVTENSSHPLQYWILLNSFQFPSL